MSIKKSVIIGLLTLSLSSIPALSLAGDLTIINDTNRESTCTLNGGACSDILGPSGITKPHSVNVVPENVMNKGCIFNKRNCVAEVHMTNNCSGPIIATVIFDVKTGIKSVQTNDTTEGYIVSGQGYTASVSGGPTLKNWFQKILGY